MLVAGQTKVTLTPWPSYTSDPDILLNSDTLLTVCEPTDQVRDAYLKKIGKTLKDFEEAPAPVLLNEEEAVPESTEDDYEPRYVEQAIY